MIFPGFDNVVERKPALGKALRKVTYTLEHNWLQRLGLSHFLVLERLLGPTWLTTDQIAATKRTFAAGAA